MSSLIGRSLGSYEIRDVIGHGGMATVYLGYRADVDRSVAIKVLPPHPGLNDDTKHRFQLEARTIANLQHPHILPLYDYGATDDGVVYLVMPYVRGGSLDRILRDGRMSVGKVARLVGDISGALDYAHRQGVIHRDIKPANIILDGEGNALLADFGIVKLAGGDSRLTGTGVVGTPAYMSPEQAQGVELTPRADLYSFGVVVWELLTGQLPYSSDSVMNLMLRHITDPVPDLPLDIPGIPFGLGDVMKKVLAKDPADRYPSGEAFNEAFQSAVLAGSTPQRAFESASAGLDPRDAHTARVDGPVTPSTPQTPGRPQQVPASAPPAEPSSPGQPGTIVIHQTPGTGNPLVFVAFGLVALIAVAALVLVLVTRGDRPEPAPLDATGIAGTALTQATPVVPTVIAQVTQAPTFGRASFSSSSADLPGDSFNMRIQNFAAAGDRTYVASLYNTSTGDRLPLGRVTVDAVGAGALSYIDPEGRNLTTLYNAIDVTLEDDPAAPAYADVRYSATLPESINAMMREIFVESPENGFRNRSLLDTAKLEATFAQQHAGLAAGARTLDARRTHNEHTLNILLGGMQDFDGTGTGSNPGTQLGLLPILDRIDGQIAAIADQPESPASVRIQAELVRVCLQNVRSWAGEIITFEQSMLLATDIESADADAQESTVFADRLLPGIDQNENGIVEPFEGECGLDQITTYGLVIASFDLFEGPRSGGSAVGAEE